MTSTSQQTDAPADGPGSNLTGTAAAPPGPKRSSGRRKWPWLLACILALLLVYNLSVWLPVSNAIGADSRNAQLQMDTYRTWLIHPTDITIDLVDAEGAAPIDHMRALFQAAEALKSRKFGRVHLARQGKTVFVMTGEDFAELGVEYGAGQNPIYLIRTLPEKLYLPDGRPAFGTWSGGWLGVLGKQMEDVSDFDEAWVSGQPPVR